ncbi:exocyst complex component EXO70B1-like [Lotus japonicus]|uniref:exocyst complex component EXO70B1-like n=1 Tax=Lotus japonicus TaxID=34305 RepID=UPI00258BA9AA|nr:exocyst complex component EXO70B1-like [Lotus japonicus]
MVQLLNFANAVVDGSPSAWRLFTILDMFKALDGLILKFQSLFPASFMNEAIAVKNKLGEASRDLFMELDKLIFRIPEVAAAADGRLHPMTTWVMRNLSNAWRSWRTQEKIFHQYPKGTNGAGTSSFTAQMERIIKLLDRKLVEKSKIYKDPALSCIFMMNNWRHIERMGEEWKMVVISGKDWFPRSRELVHQNLELYLRSSWDKVFDLLKLNNNELMVSDVEAELMKEKLDLFNFCLEQMSRVQSTWRVYDNKLREEIRTSLENVLLPAYGIFIGRFQDVLGKHAHKYIEYGMFDIQERLNNLFNGGKMNQSFDEPSVFLEAK